MHRKHSYALIDKEATQLQHRVNGSGDCEMQVTLIEKQN